MSDLHAGPPGWDADRLRMVAEVSNLGLWESNVKTGAILWSDRVWDIVGWPRDAFPMTFEAFLDLIHPEDRARLGEAVEEQVRTQGPQAIELRMRRADGRYGHFLSQWCLLLDEAGQPDVRVGSITDITGERNAYISLQQSEARLHAFMENSPAIFFIKDWEGRYLELNREYARVYRSTAEAIRGRRDDDLFPPDVVAELRRNDLEVLRTGVTIEREETVVMPDGPHTYIVQKFPLRDAAGAVQAVCGIATDITDRKNAEEASRRNERRLAEAQRLARIGSWEWDLETGVILWSDEHYRLFGAEPGGIPVGVNEFLALVDPADRALMDAVLREAAEKGTDFTIEYRGRRLDGEERWFQSRGNPARDQPGRSRRFVGTIQDITERRHADELRAALEMQLRHAQKMEAIGTLAGGIAHDFNNILAGILGNVELAGMKVGPGHPAHDHLNEMMPAILRARDLVSQLLTFSRQREQRRTLVPLPPLVAEALALLRASLPAGIEIRTRIDPAAPSVLADSTQMHQLIMNLGANAGYVLRESGGVLEIALEQVDLEADGWRPAPELPAGHYLRLSVRDNGPGMDDSVRQRLFEPFFTTKPQGEGTGLGLAVVHGIVEGHQGAITVDSRPGEGARFEVYLPAAPAGLSVDDVAAGRESTPPGGTPARKPDIRFARGGRVLLVDDEDGVTGAASHILEHLGFEVAAFNDPERALEAFRRPGEDLTLLLTDITMPRLSGVDLARRLREVRPDLPVILMSGFSATGDDAGVDDIGELLVKPFTLRTLASAIGRALARNPPGRPPS